MEVAIVKYNAGNVLSMVNALRRVGVEPIITDDPERLMTADKVVFPGVGEASSTMAYLRQHGLDKVICTLRQPVLGVCIGLQLMCRHSEEGNVDCLGIFPVDVKRFQAIRPGDKIPQMGWNTITSLDSPLFTPDMEGRYVYYVHSYYAEVCADTVARSEYTQPYSAALSRGNFHAFQFHPEKSGALGEKMLNRFLSL